ncbi:hypothetical protein [Paraliomyxa miuraensis]|uniref:hypothetical protein n=1 Tax=Paraliomyxa miuraensis TaxID=376150 RepID=UPI002254AFD5|nr:hypothetical protein [Paraliomyxa miuraensis]
MKILLQAIRSADQRTPEQLETGEVVEQEVVVEVDGTLRTFRVFLRANVLPSFDASMIYGDPLLEELLRFEPRALSTLYRIVGRYRTGSPISLPVTLIDPDESAALEHVEAPTA